jgi:hypothetical protein
MTEIYAKMVKKYTLKLIENHIFMLFLARFVWIEHYILISYINDRITEIYAKIVKKYTLKLIENHIFMLFLARFVWKAFITLFILGHVFTIWIIILEKRSARMIWNFAQRLVV